MGTLKDIYDIVFDLASHATSKKHKKEIESLNLHIAQLEREHAAEITKLEEKHAAQIARLKQNNAAQIAAMHKRTLPKRKWVTDY
jgi:phage host-nuclease inhibitor protein Gam